MRAAPDRIAPRKLVQSTVLSVLFVFGCSGDAAQSPSEATPVALPPTPIGPPEPGLDPAQRPSAPGAPAAGSAPAAREVTAADVNPDEPLEDEAVPVLGGPSAEELAEEEEPAPVGGGRVVLGHGLREVDREAFSWQGRTLRSEKVHDATKSKDTPYKINVYRDPGHTTVTRLRIDLDRDDRWDEKWTFDGEAVRRLIAPADDEHYTQTFTWAGNGWAAAD